MADSDRWSQAGRRDLLHIDTRWPALHTTRPHPNARRTQTVAPSDCRRPCRAHLRRVGRNRIWTPRLGPAGVAASARSCTCVWRRCDAVPEGRCGLQCPRRYDGGLVACGRPAAIPHALRSGPCRCREPMRWACYDGSRIFPRKEAQRGSRSRAFRWGSAFNQIRPVSRLRVGPAPETQIHGRRSRETRTRRLPGRVPVHFVSIHESVRPERRRLPFYVPTRDKRGLARTDANMTSGSRSISARACCGFDWAR